MMRTNFDGSAFNISAISDDNVLSVEGTVEREVMRILEHEGIGGEDLTFFDDGGRIDTDIQICACIFAAEGDRIFSVARNEEVPEVKAEGIVHHDEHSHYASGFKLVKDDMSVFLPPIGKTIPLAGIRRTDGHESVIASDIQSAGFLGIGKATKGRIIFRHFL